MPIVSELMSEERIPEFEEYVDVVQDRRPQYAELPAAQGCGQDAQAVRFAVAFGNTIEESGS